MNPLSDMCAVNISLTVCGLSFHPLNDVFWWLEVLNLKGVQMIDSLPSEGRSALGSVCSAFPGCRLFSTDLQHPLLPFLQSPLLRWLAVDSWVGAEAVTPLWISRTLLFYWLMPGLVSSVATGLEGWNYVFLPRVSLPAISSQQSFPRSLCISYSSLSPTPGSFSKQRWFIHPYQVLPGSGPAHCYLDRWSLTLPSVPSQQGDTSQDLHSIGLQYKVTFHLRTKT